MLSEETVTVTKSVGFRKMASSLHDGNYQTAIKRSLPCLLSSSACQMSSEKQKSDHKNAPIAVVKPFKAGVGYPKR
jgi:hypothetical protein